VHFLPKQQLIRLRLEKRIAKISGTFHLNTTLFLFLFIALAFMGGHYLVDNVAALFVAQQPDQACIKQLGLLMRLLFRPDPATLSY